MSYFTGTNLTITLDTGTDITGATDVSISYVKPDRSTGSWSATASGQDITYLTSTSDINQSGIWKLQGCATVNGNVLKSGIVTITFMEPI